MNPFRDRSFGKYWLSAALSQVGNFFTAVALPWLGMSIATDKSFAITTLLAASTLPNSLCILFGGALADRLSAHRVLLISRFGFVGCVLLLALVTALGRVTMPVLYVFSVGLGTLGALGVPASQSLLPQIVRPEQLGAANGVIMATSQSAQMVAPVIAGWLLWTVRHIRAVPDSSYDPITFAVAFALDGVGSALGLLLLLRMNLRRPVHAGTRDVILLFREGLHFCFRHRQIRIVLGYVTLISFFVQGPLLACLPLFARFQLGLYERGYGTLYAMLGLGTVLGGGLAVLTKPSPKHLGAIVSVCDVITGAALLCMSLSHTAWIAAGLLLMAGTGLGFTMVAGTTWFQTRTPGHLMGRVMGFMMFAVAGLVPISATFTGLVMAKTNVATVLACAGGIVVACAGIGLALPSVRRVGDAPATTEETNRQNRTAVLVDCSAPTLL